MEAKPQGVSYMEGISAEGGTSAWSEDPRLGRNLLGDLHPLLLQAWAALPLPQQWLAKSPSFKLSERTKPMTLGCMAPL